MLRAPLLDVDGILAAHADDLGADATGYRNHVYRVANFTFALAPSADSRIVEVAAACHDLGIWTAHTFDYLAPSAALARAQLDVPMVEAMILEHHKITRAADPLVDAFRRADWADVTHGIRAGGVPRALLTEAFARWPDAGFHAKLVRLTLGRLRTNPLDPIPVLRW